MSQFFLPTGLLALAALSTPAFAQGVAKSQGNPYENCIAAEVARSGGGMLAEAKARSACRGRYPEQAAESNRRQPSAPGGLPVSGQGTSTSGAALPTAGGSGTPSTSPSAPAAPAPVSTPAPIAMPGIGGGNPHGAPPGQAKK